VVEVEVRTRLRPHLSRFRTVFASTGSALEDVDGAAAFMTAEFHASNNELLVSIGMSDSYR
jgi:hypothetical protein